MLQQQLLPATAATNLYDATKDPQRPAVVATYYILPSKTDPDRNRGTHYDC